MEGLFSIFKIPLVQSSLWALALALATAIAARVATRILKRYLNQESNPLPSSISAACKKHNLITGIPAACKNTIL